MSFVFNYLKELDRNFCYKCLKNILFWLKKFCQLPDGVVSLTVSGNWFFILAVEIVKGSFIV